MIPIDTIPEGVFIVEESPVFVFDEIPNQVETRPKKYWESKNAFSKF